MRTRLVALIGALLLAGVGFAPPAVAEKYEAPHGPAFNNPIGGDKSRFRIERRIMQAIKSTRRDGRIRIAAYSFDRIPVAAALLDARRRGVKVQILLNDHQDTAAMRMLRARLGSDPKKPNFIYRCRSSCRGAQPNRNLHTKFYLFSKAGKSEDVVMVGSANLTLNAVAHQWNDLWTTSEKPDLYQNYVALFNDMRRDYNKRQPSYLFCAKPLEMACDEYADTMVSRVLPKRTTFKNDIILDFLDQVQCLTPQPDGTNKRTKLALSMHTIRGNRGLYLAEKIRKLYAAGCNFRVNYGIIGFYVKLRLGAVTSRGRIPMRSTGFDFNGDEEIDRYTHQKYFVVRGNFAGDPLARITMTGSSNWATLGTAQDEVIFTVHGGGVAKKYMRNFERMWLPRYSRNAYTTTYTNFRVTRMIVGADGVQRPITVTKRRAVTRVLPDQVRGAGPRWESD